MDTQLIDRVLGQLLRQPDPLRDLTLERALQRLMAARSDAPYLLLQHVIALEAAAAKPPAAQPTPVAATAEGSRPATAERSFVRDAAAVGVGAGVGVLGAGLLLGGLDAVDAVDGLDGLDGLDEL